MEENPKRVCRVLVLLDNSSDEMALTLKKELDNKAKFNKIVFRRGLFNIFFLCRHSDLRRATPGKFLLPEGQP